MKIQHFSQKGATCAASPSIKPCTVSTLPQNNHCHGDAMGMPYPSGYLTKSY
jgi:hypothetical protein